MTTYIYLNNRSVWLCPMMSALYSGRNTIPCARELPNELKDNINDVH